SQPVGDAERPELGKVPVVEDEDEVARVLAQGLDDMAVTTREIPDIARTELVGLRTAMRVNDRGAHQAFGDEGPLRRGGVPMKLTHYAGLHAHRDTGEALGYRQLDDGGLFAVAAPHHASLGFFQLELEGWKLLRRAHGIGDVILEAEIAALGTDGNRQ